MKNKFLKSILSITLLIVSPFFVLALIGTVYVISKMLGGVTCLEGIQSFFNFIYSLVPYFSYLTVIPVIIVVVTLLLKNKQKIFKMLEKR